MSDTMSVFLLSSQTRVPIYRLLQPLSSYLNWNPAFWSQSLLRLLERQIWNIIQDGRLSIFYFKSKLSFCDFTNQSISCTHHLLCISISIFSCNYCILLCFRWQMFKLKSSFVMPLTEKTVWPFCCPFPLSLTMLLTFAWFWCDACNDRPLEGTDMSVGA